MARRLKMATVQSILSLHAQGWSGRRIARELHVNRETVSRYVRRAQPPAQPDRDPANAPISSPGSQAPIMASQEPEPGRASGCAPWREAILALRDQGLSARRIHQDLVAQHAAAVSYDSVRRFLRRVGWTRPLPFRRIETAPGEEAQVDFGTGAPVIGPDGKRRRTYVFRIVLSHSRKGYSEATYRQTTEDFLHALANAFQHFGGVPKTLVIDNLKAAVKHPDWFDPELVPRVAAFAAHHGTVILPTKPYMPRHKGKVEAGVKYVQDNGLKRRRFASLTEQNQHLQDWEAGVADTRIHGTTRQHVRRCFQDVELAALLPLPKEPFPCFREGKRSVFRDGHVVVEKAFYSAPPEYVGREVWVRWDARVVRIFNQRFEQVALHPRSEPGRFSTLGAHIPSEKFNRVEHGAAWLLDRVGRIGPHAGGWGRAMLEARGIAGVRVLQGLLALARRHGAEELDRVCEVAHSYGAWRLKTLRQLLKRQAPRQERLPFLDDHPLIRPLADYGQWLRTALVRDAAPPRGFSRHGSGVRASPQRDSPDGENHPGCDARSTRPRSGYPSSGCSPAEPDSVSPDNFSLLHAPPFIRSYP